MQITPNIAGWASLVFLACFDFWLGYYCFHSVIKGILFAVGNFLWFWVYAAPNRTSGQYAELRSEIPPVGNRRIQLKPREILVPSTLVIIPLPVCVKIANLLPEGSFALQAISILGGLVLPTWLVSRLMHERRILRIGTAVQGEVTASPTEADIGNALAVAAYGVDEELRIYYRYTYGDRLWEFAKSYKGEKLGELTVLVEPDNPKHHVVLKSSYYRILKASNGGAT